jgi:hypothetical protein
MPLKISCPLPAAIPTIPAVTCPFRFDQIVKLALQRRQPTGTPPFPTLVDIQTLANWTTLKAAVANTKVATTPIFTSPALPRSEALVVGGNDNTTFKGIREYNGEGAVTFTAQMKNLPPAIYRTLKLFSQESVSSAVGVSNLTAFLINADSTIFAVNPESAPGVAGLEYWGIPIYNFRISSPGSEGFNAANINDIAFDLPSDWADFLAAVQPDFDALTAI